MFHEIKFSRLKCVNYSNFHINNYNVKLDFEQKNCNLQQCVRWLIFSREKFTYSLFNYGQHKSQLISSNSIPPSYIGLIFHYYFYWWHFWIFTRYWGGMEGFLLKDERRLNWIITQLKIFMAAHHITKEPLSYLSSPRPPALLGPPYLFCA